MSVPKFWLYLYDRLAGLPCSSGSTGDLCGNLSANCGTAAGRGVTISGSPCGAECGLPSRFFCACLCVESGLPSRFFCACPCVESGLPCGASPADSGWSIQFARGGMSGLNGTEPPVCAGRNVRPEWNGTSGLRGGAECPVGGGGLYGETPDHAPQVSRAEGGMSRSADGGSRRRAGSGYVSRSARRARKDSGKRAASAAARWRQRPGSGGRRIPASEGKQKAVFVRKPLLSYDRMRYSLSGVTLT